MGASSSIHSQSRCLFKIIQNPSRNAVDLAHKIHQGANPSSGATPIVVLHGLLGSKKNWESMCKKLTAATSKTVVAADLRNHGESPHDPSHTYQDLAADVSRLIKKLSMGEANIIGHSMGGRTAMVLALTDPSKVSSIVIVDISPMSTAGILNDFFPRLMTVMKEMNFEGLDLGKARSMARERIKASRLIEHDALMSFIIMNIGVRDGKTAWNCNLDALVHNFGDISTFPKVTGQKFHGPALFIGGGQSNYIPPTDLTGIKDLFPNADLKYVKQAGHNVHAEDPVTFLEIVVEFLKVKKL